MESKLRCGKEGHLWAEEVNCMMGCVKQDRPEDLLLSLGSRLMLPICLGMVDVKMYFLFLGAFSVA